MKKVLSIALVSTMALTAIAASTKTAQAAVSLDSNHVQVEAGDTYKSIAANAGVTIAELEQANGREVGGFDLIFPGETVTLPGATAAQASTDNSATQQATQATTENTGYQAPAQQTQTQDTQATQSASQTTQTNTNTSASTQTSTSQSTGTSQGTYKISFYDPAVLGSNMGYSGVAANLSVFPKGTQLRITLSDGTVLNRTVNDTGTFAYSNPNQLDVAMPNNQIPSYGVTTASVEVV
ncbi:LysM peptidoglycan-binding domain-containing protein [Companilactobacillus halodurans]|uniref:LysM peptidoglycan-binding domain-containing protein n=1 Tax=Companilactobacillus halodurans TaxID=2584183 RepID=A0A5P0ZQE7_9LACO|nr:LysM peptidoglycan-binding domain-containing protein [Companilactobacillus halodurans]MQS76339.1 LysM peptidoglycan-binding domain-containing protein [Companilactobacillus halodurans]MQS96963.1 LysM peptidoglycan-binding domain-containing protein [Companilactobacillus halodurans]